MRPPSRAALRAFWLVSLVSFGWAPPVQADPSATDKVEAEALFQEGKKLMLQKRWAEACPRLEASQKLDPAGGTLFNLALCHESEGKLALAWAEFTDALAQARKDKKNDRIKSAGEHLDKLSARLPRLSVRLAGARPPGLRIERDGSPMNEASLDTPIPVDPGSHTVRAAAPGHHPVEKTISLAEGESKTLDLAALVAIPPPAASSAPPPASSSSAPPPPASDLKTVGYIVGGVGIASLAVGTFFGLRAASRKSESDAACPSATTCSARGAQANNEAYTAANIANVGVGLGLLGVGVGAYLIFSSPSPATSSAVRVSPALGQNEGGLVVSGRF